MRGVGGVCIGRFMRLHKFRRFYSFVVLEFMRFHLFRAIARLRHLRLAGRGLAARWPSLVGARPGPQNLVASRRYSGIHLTGQQIVLCAGDLCIDHHSVAHARLELPDDGRQAGQFAILHA